MSSYCLWVGNLEAIYAALLFNSNQIVCAPMSEGLSYFVICEGLVRGSVHPARRFSTFEDSVTEVASCADKVTFISWRNCPRCIEPRKDTAAGLQRSWLPFPIVTVHSRTLSHLASPLRNAASGLWLSTRQTLGQQSRHSNGWLQQQL